jgi:hypothetical protein
VVLAPVTVVTRRRALLFAGGLAFGLALVGCGEERTRTERFCERLREDASVLSGVPPTPEGLEQVIEAYREVGEVTPLAIAEDWSVISTLISAAASADPTNPAALEQVRADAIAATQAIRRVTTFAAENCGVSLDGLPVPTSPATTPDGSTVPPASPGTLPPSSG